jgi:flagellar protein FliO/FliZ
VIELVLRIGFSLLIVLGLMWVLARAIRRPPQRGEKSRLSVLSRQQLGRTASVTVVLVGSRALILGVTEGQVNLLGEADPAEFAPTGDTLTHRAATHVHDGWEHLLHGKGESVRVRVAGPVSDTEAARTPGERPERFVTRPAPGRPHRTLQDKLDALRDRTARR